MSEPAFQPLAGIYEPSAIQQLPDGRFVVVEDEKQHPLGLFGLAGDGRIEIHAVERNADETLGKLDDLEGLTLDKDGNLYAITSHSLTGDGEVKKSRNKLVRFRIEGNRVTNSVVIAELRTHLIALHPLLAVAASEPDVKAAGGLNIEAIEMTPDTQQLLIGFRSPLLDRKAIIACLENPAALFDHAESPRFAPALSALDLGGDGIRGMSWIPQFGAYLVISGPVAREQVHFRLWFWTGLPNDPPRPVSVPGLPGFAHAEGVSPALIEGRQFVIIVSDDGSREEARCAHYLLLEPAQLRIG
jgi:hypothetical protein